MVRTGRQGVYYLHEKSSLSFQTLGAARVAVHAMEQSEITGTGHDNQEDDEDEDRIEILSLCCCLDGVIGQLIGRMSKACSRADIFSMIVV